MNTLFGIIVLFTVCYIPLVSAGCSDDTVRVANITCLSHLDEMEEEERKGHGAYPMLCAIFNDYLKCMDPSLEKCTQKILFEYKTFQELYTRPPYRCRITPTYSGSQHITMSALILLLGLSSFSLLQIA
ncbi:Hypothetical predicted protein [Argonauta hians]